MKYFSFFGALISAVWYTPRLLWIIHQEKELVKKIVDQEKIDLIVSDNRYGSRHPLVKSVLVCHFLNIVLPGRWKVFSPLLNFFYNRWLKRFHEIWIPDDASRRLSGELSKVGLPSGMLKFIGPLSRFTPVQPTIEKTYDVTAIISGPEPLKSRFAEKIFSSLSGFPGRCLVLVGGNELLVPSVEKVELRYNVSTSALEEIICRTRLVISRSGYSSIMDYDRLQCRVLMVPTPGQPEQLYLARLMAERGHAAYVGEEQLDQEIIRESMTSKMIFRGGSSPDLLESQIRQSLL